jgi:peptidoglycan/LPS O-acetylase OafA/YrhL
LDDFAAQRPKAGTAFKIPSLDGIRAVAFGIVFAAHSGLDEVVPGGFGVTVFFFLSGYLITTLLRREQERHGRISLKAFYLRRVLRILPPFYVVLTLAVLLSLADWIPREITFDAVLAQALHYANYFIVFRGYEGFAAGTGVYWSLAVEEHFYLVFPWLFLLLSRTSLRPSGKAVVLIALCAFTLLWRVVLVFAFEAGTVRTNVATDTRVDSLLFGCALALYENPALDSSALSESIWKRVMFPLGVIGLFASLLIRTPEFRETFRYSLQGMSLIPVFVCAIRYPTWFPMRFLSLGPVAYLGLLSYSLYLVHQIVLQTFHHSLPGVPGVPRALLSFAISVGFAWLLYKLVEAPCARLRRRLET